MICCCQNTQKTVELKSGNQKGKWYSQDSERWPTTAVLHEVGLRKTGASARPSPR